MSTWDPYDGLGTPEDYLESFERPMTDAEKHNFKARTEVERSERDKLAEPAEAKWLRALQPTDTDEPKGTPS
jgi:hypothetical protein